jgi:hypothetical protein
MPNGTATDTLEQRIKRLRRAYGRGLGHKPSLVEEATMARAARLTARAEAAARNPALGIDQLVRIENCAARARQQMFDMLRPKSQPAGSSLEEYLARTPLEG